jgi:hypothetical protein
MLLYIKEERKLGLTISDGAPRGRRAESGIQLYRYIHHTHCVCVCVSFLYPVKPNCVCIHSKVSILVGIHIVLL